ncbi:MAG: CGLD27 family protein [Snowella sp.]|nr:CGLD27 family protein [Snowella sp.]
MKPDSSSTFCPVPLEQQPVNEYETLKESWLCCWATLERFAYGRRLFGVFLFGWILVSPIAAASFYPLKKPVFFVLAAGLGAMLLVALVLIRILLGWYYIRDRLQADKVIYEESGWYDGQIWAKPPEILARDRLIVTYQINPVLQRLTRTGLVLIALIGLDSLIWLSL